MTVHLKLLQIWVAIPYSSGQSFQQKGEVNSYQTVEESQSLIHQVNHSNLLKLQRIGMQLWEGRNPLFIRSIIPTIAREFDPFSKQMSQSLIHQVNHSNREYCNSMKDKQDKSQSLIHQVNHSNIIYILSYLFLFQSRNPLFIRSIIPTISAYLPACSTAASQSLIHQVNHSNEKKKNGGGCWLKVAIPYSSGQSFQHRFNIEYWGGNG